MNNDLTKEMFSNVYGYEDVKRELNLIKSWLTDEEILNNDKLMLPTGILFYGRPGNGKTLLLREFAGSFKAPIFVIEGKSENKCGEIVEAFAKARQEKFAVVVIDEIDLLIARNENIERVLQQELDGFTTRGSILVLATTNNIREIEPALLRPGRFDRTIDISEPNEASRKEIFDKFLRDLDVPMDNIDTSHVAKVCTRTSGADIRGICNDAYLRCKKNMTTRDVEISYRRVVRGIYTDKSIDFKDMRVAIHEAGHAIAGLLFKKNWDFYSAYFTCSGGETEIHEADEDVDSVEKREQSIMISMAGYLAEQLFYGKHGVGSYSDYNKAHDMCRRLLERVCIQGIVNHVEPYQDNNDREDTFLKRWRNERKEAKLLKKYERMTRSLIKSHKKEIERFANLMYEKGTVTYKDFALSK
ncbi:MAG: AAA family ATPase [Bacilli bacterium]|nr:AAA family ATPase [Bacilli bacterium]